MHRTKKEARFIHALITIVLMVVFMFVCLVVLRSNVLVPLIFGCMAAGCVSVYLGYTWEEILDGMVDGITPSLEAILILLLIGMLAGTWITCGTVPSILYYGLRLVTPTVFLPSCMLVCLITAFIIGSWGTVGTMGIAFMGMGLTLGLPAPAVAGAIVSGAYMGEVISPLSDATNLTGAVVGENVFSVVRRVLPAAVTAGLLALILYALIGLRLSAGTDKQAVAESLAMLSRSLKSQFHISPLALLPLLIMVLCILIRLPAIPSMLLGSIAGMIQAVFLQHTPAADVMKYAAYGYISSTGNDMVDSLLSAGGIQSMLTTISIILIAMAFGGIMKRSGQMKALVHPLQSWLRSDGILGAAAVFTCIFMNMILPDQYLGISLPGQMYAQAYRDRGLSKASLGAAVLGGGAVTSPLIPWNSCGFYCMSILAVSPAVYGRFALYGLLLPVITILFGFLPKKAPPR